MHVASLELCKTLHELSGWPDSDYEYWDFSARSPALELCKGLEIVDELPGTRVLVLRIRSVDYLYKAANHTLLCPAYDLDYLLRKLPAYIRNIVLDREYLVLSREVGGKWLAAYQLINDDAPDAYGFPFEADTPEDAACKLAIELFKQGVLKKEAQNGE